MIVALDATLESFIAEQVASGHFSDAGQVVRTALQLLAETDLAGSRQAIRAELSSRMDDGALTLPSDEVFGRIEARHGLNAG